MTNKFIQLSHVISQETAFKYIYCFHAYRQIGKLIKMQIKLYQISRMPKQAVKSYEKSKAGVTQTVLQHISSAEKKIAD